MSSIFALLSFIHEANFRLEEIEGLLENLLARQKIQFISCAAAHSSTAGHNRFNHTQ